MTDFNVHTLETAGDSKSMLEQSQQSYGFIPNLHAVMAESPVMLESYKTLAGIFNNTNLSETERQVVLMTNNRLNGCTYCMAAHTTISQMAKVPGDVIQSLRDGTPIADPKLEALRTYAEKVNLTRGFVEQADIDALLAAGYTRETLLEVIVGTSLKVLSNYTNHVTHTPVDKQFAKNEWSAEPQPVG